MHLIYFNVDVIFLPGQYQKLLNTEKTARASTKQTEQMGTMLSGAFCIKLVFFRRKRTLFCLRTKESPFYTGQQKMDTKNDKSDTEKMYLFRDPPDNKPQKAWRSDRAPGRISHS